MADDPHQGVHVFSEYRGDLSLSCQVLVIGSGPCGSVVAKELAEGGRDVIVLEEGPPVGLADFRLDALATMRRLFREGGMRATRGNLFMPTMQAMCLGGGSLVNSAICCRAPDWLFEQWQERCGTDEITPASMGPHYDRVEKVLHVEPTPDVVQGRRNSLFKEGCDKLGIHSAPMPRATQDCGGSSECFTGCRNRAKQSADLTYLPRAVRAGARVYSSIRAERIHASGRRASRVSGHVVEPFTGKVGAAVDIAAELVVLAAGCLATPVILQKSGIGNSSGYVGRELAFHPGLAIMGIFPDPVRPWEGATQGYHSLEYLREGLKLEVLWAPPSVLAVRFPGVGREFLERLTTYDRMAPFDVLVATKDSRGSVNARYGTFDPKISFEFAQSDVDRIQKGLGYLSDIFWAAGATSILPGLHGIPERITSRAEAEIIRSKRLRARDTITASNHAFGSTRMAKRADRGVVDQDGRCHDLDNVYIADTGVFPGSPAINPMLTGMALADRIALKILTR